MDLYLRCRYLTFVDSLALVGFSEFNHCEVTREMYSETSSEFLIKWLANPFQPTFNWIHNEDKIFHVRTDDLANIESFWIWCLQRVPKKLGRGACLPLCYITIAFNNAHLGTEHTSCFRGGILSQSCLMYNFSCSTVKSRILRLIKCPAFLMGHRTQDSLTIKPSWYNTCRVWLGIVLLK